MVKSNSSTVQWVLENNSNSNTICLGAQGKIKHEATWMINYCFVILIHPLTSIIYMKNYNTIHSEHLLYTELSIYIHAHAVVNAL